MLKKLTLIGLITAATCGFSLAYADSKKVTVTHYKGEIVEPIVTPAYYYHGPYMGITIGDKINYTARPTTYNGLEGTVAAGYAFLNQNFYLAGEIFAGDSVSLQNYANNGNARSTWSYGASIIPGTLITDKVMSYLRAGVIRTRFTTDSTVTGGQVGVGIQTAISPAWDLRGEYDYNFYRHVNHIGNPKAGQFNIGLIYKI